MCIDHTVVSSTMHCTASCYLRAAGDAPAVIKQEVVLQPGIVALRPQVLRLAGR